MARYIDADKLEDGAFVKVTCEYQQGWNDALNGASLTLPTADVVEVKHGEWIVAEECKTPLSHGYIRTEKTYICPFCTHHFRKKMKFCGECGAKMDGQTPQKLNHNSLCETETYKVGDAE